ncbi:MAG TPA: hypothetical protein VF898_14360 [Chloroflexota bacterium]
MYWIWRDGAGALHASGFAPSSGFVRSVIAVTARDALIPISGGTPKHDVTDAAAPAVVWSGRCAELSATA